jgi:glycosyltransferase involved in cell wall biosynthesis
VVARVERGTPLLVTEHGVYLRERYLAVSTTRLPVTQRRFLLAIAELCAAVTYAHADVLAPVCAWNTRWERRLGAGDEMLVPILNGVDVEAFTPRDKPRTSPGHGRPTVVAAARIFPLKDIETMIRAAAVTRERVPDVLFLVYGSLTADPDYVARCRALIEELDLTGTFVLAGLAPEPTEIFNQGDIGVLSSVSEAFPYTVLEALACARPVAATDVGGVSEMLEGWGILVPPRDAGALGRACADLLADPQRRALLGRRGRERVLARFRSSMVVDRYAELYAEIGTPPEPAVLEPADRRPLAA